MEPGIRYLEPGSMASKHPLADGKTIMAEFISKRANNKSHARTHAGHHSHAYNHNSASLSLSLFLLRSRSPAAVVERKKNNNTSWPNFCSRCFCLRRCQRRKQGGVRHRRTLIKHSQRPHTHKRGTQTHKMDGGAGRERECEREGQTRVRARRPDAAALSVTNVPLFCFMCVVSAPHCSFFNCHFSHKFTQSSAALLTALPVSSSWEFLPFWVRRILLVEQWCWKFQLELQVRQRQKFYRMLMQFLKCRTCLESPLWVFYGVLWYIQIYFYWNKKFKM